MFYHFSTLPLVLLSKTMMVLFTHQQIHVHQSPVWLQKEWVSHCSFCEPIKQNYFIVSFITPSPHTLSPELGQYSLSCFKSPPAGAAGVSF